MNWNRVFLGGIAAGFVVNAGEMVAAVVLRDEYLAAMQALGHSAQVPAGTFILGLIITWGMAIFAVWLYAAIRPRFGPGPRTAAIAGFATWLIEGSSNLRYLTLGLFPPGLVAIAGAFALAEFILATLVGAWLYREKAPA
jgi:hypothetical protein